MSEITNDLTPFHSAMTDLGIDASQLDNDPVEFPDSLAETPETAADEQGGESEINEESDLESAPSEDVKPEDEENKEGVQEETKLTVKEFQEIEAAKAAIEAEKKSFQEERSKLEKEFELKSAEMSEKVESFNELDSFLGHMASTDPELFELFKTSYAEHQKSYSNPVMQKVSQEVADLKKELSQFKAKASDEVTLTKLSADMDKVKATVGKEAEAAGLKVDYKLVEEVWADNPKLSLEEAFYSKYGAQLAKASASKAKVSQAEKKVQSRPPVSTSGTVSKSNTPVTKDYSKMSYLDVLKEEMRNLKN